MSAGQAAVLEYHQHVTRGVDNTNVRILPEKPIGARPKSAVASATTTKAKPLGVDVVLADSPFETKEEAARREARELRALPREEAERKLQEAEDQLDEFEAYIEQMRKARVFTNTPQHQVRVCSEHWLFV